MPLQAYSVTDVEPCLNSAATICMSWWDQASFCWSSPRACGMSGSEKTLNCSRKNARLIIIITLTNWAKNQCVLVIHSSTLPRSPQVQLHTDRSEPDVGLDLSLLAAFQLWIITLRVGILDSSTPTLKYPILDLILTGPQLDDEPQSRLRAEISK